MKNYLRRMLLIAVYITIWTGPLGDDRANGAAALEVGNVPPLVTIEGANGGQIDGKPWESSSLTGVTWSVIYVDPDQRDDNALLEEALGKADFPPSEYRTVGIVNMAATWLPNVMLEAKLKEKQQTYPNAVYVKDETKHLVKSWGVPDDAYVFLLFSPQGQLIYQKSGTLDKEEVKKVIELIRSQEPTKVKGDAP